MEKNEKKAGPLPDTSPTPTDAPPKNPEPSNVRRPDEPTPKKKPPTYGS